MRFCPRPFEAGAKVLGLGMLRATLLARIAIPEKQLLLYLIAKTLGSDASTPATTSLRLWGLLPMQTASILSTTAARRRRFADSWRMLVSPMA